MEGPFAWTPDSREIIFSSDRGGLRSLWRISAYGGTPRRVEGVGTRATAPAIAPIGNRLAYTSEVLKVNLWKVRLTDRRHAAGPAQLILPSAGFIGIASFSPDGKKLAYESISNGLQRNLDGRQRRFQSNATHVPQGCGWNSPLVE